MVRPLLPLLSHSSSRDFTIRTLCSWCSTVRAVRFPGGGRTRSSGSKWRDAGASNFSLLFPSSSSSSNQSLLRPVPLSSFRWLDHLRPCMPSTDPRPLPGPKYSTFLSTVFRNRGRHCRLALPVAWGAEARDRERASREGERPLAPFLVFLAGNLKGNSSNNSTCARNQSTKNPTCSSLERAAHLPLSKRASCLLAHHPSR